MLRLGLRGLFQPSNPHGDNEGVINPSSPKEDVNAMPQYLLPEQYNFGSKLFFFEKVKGWKKVLGSICSRG